MGVRMLLEKVFLIAFFELKCPENQRVKNMFVSDEEVEEPELEENAGL